MEVLAVIPARFASKRFPGKLLKEIKARAVIQWVYENAKGTGLLDKVIIATDDKRIFKKAKQFGAEVLMTSKDYRSGTERVACVARRVKAKIVVNIQGDEPLLKPAAISRLVEEFRKEKQAKIATLVTRIKNPQDLNNPNVVKVVFDKAGYALYFSRSPIPYFSPQPPAHSPEIFYKHLGIYAYRRDFLLEFIKLPVSALERTEGLEQLRALENGFKIKVIKVSQDTVGIDTPQDLRHAERLL